MTVLIIMGFFFVLGLFFIVCLCIAGARRGRQIGRLLDKAAKNNQK